MIDRTDGLPGRVLVVAPVPGRKGRWLVTENGPVFHVLAKFRDEDAVEEFLKWVREGEGKTLKFVKEEE